MQVIDADTGEVIIRKIGNRNALEISLSREESDLIRNYRSRVIGMYSHPTNLMPTGSDFVASGYRRYDFGIVGTHDGKLYKYRHGSSVIFPQTVDSSLEKACDLCKNENEEKMLYRETMHRLCKDWGLLCEELE